MGTIHNVLWKFRYLNIYQQISDITFPNVQNDIHIITLFIVLSKPNISDLVMISVNL